MCGIFAVFSRNGDNSINVKKHGKRFRSLRELAYTMSGRQRHRGPDHTGVVALPDHGVCLVHERLSIVGVKAGDQPMKSANGQIILVANGEIYNYQEIAAEIRQRKPDYVPRSDCDVLIDLYEERGRALLSRIRGMFAFVLYDTATRELLIARDPFGIIPLYRGEDGAGNIWLASEMKCLVPVCERIEVFPPGSAMFGKIDSLERQQWFEPAWRQSIPRGPVRLRTIEQSLVAAVRTHLHCDAVVPFGALLSGGVDSSLIAAIATRVARERDPTFRLKTYSVGLANAPDFQYSRQVAEYLNSDHREVVFSVADAMDCIREIIYHVETYDVTTVRCSIPMTILARAIRAEGLKMILSGEGADEIFGGYLYFYNAPNREEFHRELVTRVGALHLSDCQRANKSAHSYGLELRVPFLDTDFVNVVMDIDAAEKMPVAAKGRTNGGATNGNQTAAVGGKIEKHILRAAFADGNYLPDEVLWRQKEQFSDGVGYEWIDTIRATASEQISDVEFAEASSIFPFNTPTTKEAFYYRAVFAERFPGESCARTVMRWIPRMDWGCSEDPSGRAQQTHTAAYDDGGGGGETK